MATANDAAKVALKSLKDAQKVLEKVVRDPDAKAVAADINDALLLHLTKVQSMLEGIASLKLSHRNLKLSHRIARNAVRALRLSNDEDEPFEVGDELEDGVVIVAIDGDDVTVEIDGERTEVWSMRDLL